MIRSLSPSAACAAGKNSESTTFCGALLHHHHGVEVGLEQLVVADLGEQLGAEVGPVHRGDRDVGGAVREPVLGDLGRPLGGLDDGVVVAGDDVVPVPAAVDERLERELEDEGALGLAAGGGRVDALRPAVGQRAVDDQRRAAAGDLDGEPDVLDHGPAPPVAGREGVEVGAEREPLARAHPQRGARLDLLGVDGLAGRGGLPDRGVVEVLGRAVAADLVAVGVELGVLGVDVEGEDVEVAVERHDLPLQHPAVGLRAVRAGRAAAFLVVRRRVVAFGLSVLLVDSVDSVTRPLPRLSARRRRRSAA